MSKPPTRWAEWRWWKNVTIETLLNWCWCFRHDRTIWRDKRWCSVVNKGILLDIERTLLATIPHVFRRSAGRNSRGFGRAVRSELRRPPSGAPEPSGRSVWGLVLRWRRAVRQWRVVAQWWLHQLHVRGGGLTSKLSLSDFPSRLRRSSLWLSFRFAFFVCVYRKFRFKQLFWLFITLTSLINLLHLNSSSLT